MPKDKLGSYGVGVGLSVGGGGGCGGGIGGGGCGGGGVDGGVGGGVCEETSAATLWVAFRDCRLSEVQVQVLS